MKMNPHLLTNEDENKPGLSYSHRTGGIVSPSDGAASNDHENYKTSFNFDMNIV